MEMFKEPPCQVYAWGGNAPQICCPDSEPIEQYEGSNYDYAGDYDYSEYDFVNDFCETNPPLKCPSGSSCVVSDECGAEGLKK